MTLYEALVHCILVQVSILEYVSFMTDQQTLFSAMTMLNHIT